MSDLETRPSPPDELGCDAALEIASASFDGEASLEEIDRLAIHLVDCSSCRATVEELEAADLRLRRAGRGPVEVPSEPPTVTPIARPAPRRAGPRAPRRSRRRWLPVALAAAVVAGVLLLRPADAPRPVHTADLELPGGEDREDGSAPSQPGDPPTAGDLDAEDLAVALEQRLAQAEILLAHHPRANPFRSRRSNPFRDPASDRSSNPELEPFDGPHPFRTTGRSNRSRQRL